MFSNRLKKRVGVPPLFGVPPLYRRGFFCLGALRELFVIGAVVGCVLTMVWQANLTLSVHAKSQQKVDELSFAIKGISIDRDKSALIAWNWPRELKTINLETGIASPLRIPEGCVSSVTSARNSTTVMMAEWTENYQLRHRVDIVCQDELTMSEEVIFEPPTAASISVSTDGQIVALLSGDGHVIGWDLTESNRFRWEFQLGTTSPRCSLSPDGRRLFIAPSKGNIFLCDARTGANRTNLGETELDCRSMDWSDDGRQLAVGDASGGISVFESDSGKRIWHERIKFEFARSVAFSADGNLLAVGGFDQTIRVWNLSQPDNPPINLTGQKGVIRALKFTPSDQALISGSLDGSIYEWSLASGMSIRRLQ